MEIKSAGEKITSVTLHDVSGKMVNRMMIEAMNQITMDVTQLTRGFYTVTIETEQGHRSVKKLILD